MAFSKLSLVRRLAGGAAVVALVLLLVACGGGNTNNKSSNTGGGTSANPVKQVVPTMVATALATGTATATKNPISVPIGSSRPEREARCRRGASERCVMGCDWRSGERCQVPLQGSGAVKIGNVDDFRLMLAKS